MNKVGEKRLPHLGEIVFTHLWYQVTIIGVPGSEDEPAAAAE